MMSFNRNSSLILAVLLLLLAIGCSGGVTGPVSPPIEPVAGACESNRVLWGLWDISFDTEALTVDVMPVRNAGAHFDFTGMLIPPECDDCISIYITSFDEDTRILIAYVSLKNPSSITGYDVRGILHTDVAGHELLNVDDWTGLWDIPGGGEINPFMAFAKDKWKRAFPAGETLKEYYHVYIPEPPQYNSITFAVDASWPGNCKEPYAIDHFEQAELDETTGSTADVQVDVRDWQFDIDSVILAAPGITGEATTSFTYAYGNTWTLELTNNTGAEAGYYEALISATSTGSGTLALHQYVTITVSADGAPFSPVDVTPPWLCFYPVEACFEGEYAYFAESFNGMSIYDISDPLEWEWIANVRTTGDVDHISVGDGYVYAISREGVLSIVDVDPPESAFLVTTIQTPGKTYDIDSQDGYAYIAAMHDDLVIVDVDPPETAHIIGMIEILGSYADAVDVSGDYAYIGTSSGGAISIIDVSDPESAFLVNSVDKIGQYYDVAAKDGYVFAQFSGVYIFDVDPPEEAHFVDQIYGFDEGSFTIDGDHMYMWIGDHVSIYDITDPESPELIQGVDFPHSAQGLGVSGGYAYVYDEWYFQVYVIDIDPVGTAHLAGSFDTSTRIRGLDVSGPYVYAVDGYSTIFTYDVDPLESTEFVTGSAGYCASGVLVDGSFAYISSSPFGLTIMSLSNPMYPAILKTVDTPGQARDVAVQDGYAYVADNSMGLTNIDIDPISYANVVCSVPVFQYSDYVDVDGDYAYVSDGDVGLQIIDINPPESAHIVKTVGPMGTVKGVALDNGYVFVVDSYTGLHIVDVSDPETAEIINTVILPDTSQALTVDGGYAYVTSSPDTLMVVDIDPVESAFLLTSTGSLGYSGKIAVQDNYAYLTGSIYGLRIIELW